jgi:hypothetical protein
MDVEDKFSAIIYTRIVLKYLCLIIFWLSGHLRTLFGRQMLCVIGQYGTNSKAAVYVYLNVGIFDMSLKDSEKNHAHLQSNNR